MVAPLLLFSSSHFTESMIGLGSFGLTVLCDLKPGCCFFLPAEFRQHIGKLLRQRGRIFIDVGQVHLRVGRACLGREHQPAPVRRQAVPGVHQPRIGAQAAGRPSRGRNDIELDGQVDFASTYGEAHFGYCAAVLGRHRSRFRSDQAATPANSSGPPRYSVPAAADRRQPPSRRSRASPRSPWDRAA